MAKKVIQVPIDGILLDKLNSFSRKQNLARAELIRVACVRYLTQVEREEMDRRYRDGYTKFPEDTDCGTIQISLAGVVLSKETW